MKDKRRDFLKLTGRGGFADALKLDTVRIGIIGLRKRSPSHRNVGPDKDKSDTRHKKISMQLKNLILFFFCLTYGHLAVAQSSLYSVLDYGAVNDGRTITTKAIQNAIDDCADKGGGTINFPAGKYLSGTLILRSNIVLNLLAGAELLGSGKMADYPPIAAHFASYSSNFLQYSLIFAENLQHIAITGQGKINGQGNLFPRGPEKTRPVLIRMVGCRDITIRDISLEKPGMWTQHYLDCEALVIDHITVAAWNANVNNDGIDIDCCDGVVISNSFIRSDDDAICLKSDSPKPCRNITITNCILSSAANGLKCGTDSYGGFENIVVSNCVITNTMLSGIALESVDGGYINNFLISNIVMKDVNNPVFIRLGNRGRVYTEGGQQKGPGTIKNIKIDNISATGTGDFKIDSADKYLFDQHFHIPNTSIGCPISGLPGHDIENLSLTNISISFKGGGTKNDAGIAPPEQEKDYPEYWMFGNLPSYAFYIRHAKGLIMRNVDVSCEQTDHRPAIYMRDVDSSRISDFKAFSGLETGCFFLIDSSRQILIRDCYVTGKEGLLASIKNRSTSIYFINNSLFSKRTKFIKDETIKKSDIKVKRFGQ